MSELIEIDGSLLEGGGQILRASLTLSALLSVPIWVKNIRAGRSKPGLMAQHLKGLHLIRDITNGTIEGDCIGSEEIKFWPDKITAGNFTADTKTAGSITLLLQVSLPCILFADSPTCLTLCGGTNTEMAPQVDYMTEVFRPNLEKFGVTFDFEMSRRGYFPKGGGIVRISVNPVKELRSVTMVDQGQVSSVYGWSFVAGSLPLHMAHAAADSASDKLKRASPSVDIERYKENPSVAPHNCSGLVLVAESTTGCYLGSSALGRRTVSPAETGSAAADELLEDLQSGACVDRHCQDQVIIFMALARGNSKIKVDKITTHTQTVIYVTEKLARVKFHVADAGNNKIISCDGIGYENSKL